MRDPDSERKKKKNLSPLASHTHGYIHLYMRTKKSGIGVPNIPPFITGTQKLAFTIHSDESSLVKTRHHEVHPLDLPSKESSRHCKVQNSTSSVGKNICSVDNREGVTSDMKF